MSRLCDMPTYGLNGLREVDKHPAYAKEKHGTLYCNNGIQCC